MINQAYEEFDVELKVKVHVMSMDPKFTSETLRFRIQEDLTSIGWDADVVFLEENRYDTQRIRDEKRM